MDASADGLLLATGSKDATVGLLRVHNSGLVVERRLEVGRQGGREAGRKGGPPHNSQPHSIFSSLFCFLFSSHPSPSMYLVPSPPTPLPPSNNH